jgi:hypothetical protein
MDAIAIPGGRDVRAIHDGDEDAEAVVVACPPHPQYGGSRSDQRLRAVSAALENREVACLRFDYGPWDEGRGERRDAGNALAWADDRFAAVGLFGYSFGAEIALRAAGDADPAPAAVSALAPPAEAVDALDDVPCPTQICFGERDDTVDSTPVAERGRALEMQVESLPADHHFVGQTDRVAGLVADFFENLL